MSRQSERLPSRGQKPEKVYFLLRWPVIVVAFLFVWPLGVILLITKIIGAVRKNRQEKVLQDNKIPFAKSKSKEDKQAYAAHCSRQKKRLITSFLMTALFLLLGCWGMTRDYLQLFWGSGFTGKLAADFLSHGIFLLVGIFLAAKAYDLLVQQRRLARLLTLIGNAGVVHLDQLLERSGETEYQLLLDLQAMLDRAYLGHGAFYDAQRRTLYCRADAAPPEP